MSVTVHARLRCRQISHAGFVDVAVTVATIKAELPHMKRMAVRDRLHRSVSDPRILRRGVVGGRSGHRAGEDEHKNNDLERQLIGRLRENLRHTREEPVGGGEARLHRIARSSDSAFFGPDGERHVWSMSRTRNGGYGLGQ